MDAAHRLSKASSKLVTEAISQSRKCKTFFIHIFKLFLQTDFSVTLLLPSSNCLIFFFHYVFLCFSTSVSPCQQCQPDSRRAEKIEQQIEQSISVRIHQCQTIPSLAVCIERAHTDSYFDWNTSPQQSHRYIWRQHCACVKCAPVIRYILFLQ